MGSRIIQLTPVVRSAKAAGGGIGSDDAIEVLGYRSMRLVLAVYGVDDADSPHLGVEIRTAMDLKDMANAPILGGFIFTGKTVVMAQTFTGFLRYVWWSVPDFQGEGASAFYFTLEGVVYD